MIYIFYLCIYENRTDNKFIYISVPKKTAHHHLHFRKLNIALWKTYHLTLESASYTYHIIWQNTFYYRPVQGV